MVDKDGMHPLVPDVPLAFLVDGENAPANLVGEMLAEASRYGISIVKRVYGDWTSPRMARWKEVLHEHALAPVIQIANISGKNATDILLVIEAMDILHDGMVKGFCLVSSDSDFTRLAMRIRERGLFVMGIGNAGTPASLRNACNVFALIENLAPKGPAITAVPGQAVPKAPVAKRGPVPPEAIELIEKAFDASVRDDGWANVGQLGNAALKLDSSFDSRSFAYAKLGDLLRAIPTKFVVEVKGEPGREYLAVRRK